MQAQKAKLQQQLAELEVELATLQVLSMLALLVQKYLLYWHRGTEGEAAAADGGAYVC